MGRGSVRKISLTRDDVIEVLDYNPDNGDFRWKVKTGTAKSGDIAGCLNRRGQRYIRIRGELCLAGRLAWLIMTGEWPIGRIVKKNRIGDDNRWENICLPSDLIQPLTSDRLRQIIDYDPASGRFTWKLRIGVKVKIGEEAGSNHSGGYINLTVGGHTLFAHQAA